MNLQSVIPFWMELEYYKQYQNDLRNYLGVEQANWVISEALYLLSLGTNDFLENYYIIPHGRSSQFSIEQYQDFLVGIARDFVTELYYLGARKISLGGLPPMGCLPLERTTNIFFGSQCIEEYNTVALQFNGKLQALVENLNATLVGLRLVYSDPYEILYDMIQNPIFFGEFNFFCFSWFFKVGFLTQLPLNLS